MLAVFRIMNDQPKPKSKWYWRVLRGFLICVAVLATLVAILVTEENWRGKRDWEAYKRAAEARGERFDWSASSPNSVPESENFAKAPIFSYFTTMVWDEQSQDWKSKDAKAVDPAKMSIYRADGFAPEGKGGSWEEARLTSMEHWQEYYRTTLTNGVKEFPIAPQPQSPAADVLLALSKYDSAIEELRVNCQRPYFRPGSYSLNDWEYLHLFPLMARFKGMTQVLHLRAIAELNNHQEDKALADISLALRLDDQVRQVPLLIGHLVSIAMSSLALQPVYEGLAEHRWNDVQLAELERLLAAKDFLADYQYAMSGERIFAVDALEDERVTREFKTVLGDGQRITNSLYLMPSAYFYQNELAFASMNDKWLQPLVDVTNRLVSPAALTETEAAIKQGMKHYSPYTIMATMTFPAIDNSVKKFAVIQAGTDLARVACALERYRLANGKYPDSLNGLEPQFIEKLPHDIINGQPLHYRLRDDGNFVLYSVGWNETDDGGKVVLTKSGKVDREKGDWVWEYPEK
jgi:hypothetical protein